MVCEFGMSDKLGPISYSDEEEHLFLGREIARTRSHSEETARAIDAEVRRIVDEQYSRAKELLQKNRPGLETVAQHLLKYETLTGEEVRMLLRGEKIDELKDRELAEDKAREEKAAADRESEPAPDPGWKPGGALPGPQQA
jgi:cell division protease FtsH